jgi:hypothetical protein
MVRTLHTAFALLMMLVPPVVASAQIHSTPLDPKEMQRDIRPHVQMTGAIEGHVVGIDKLVERNAMVTAIPRDESTNSGHEASASVAADGSYTIAGIGEGNYAVALRVDGYPTLFFKNATQIADATPVIVVDGKTSAGIDFTAEAAMRVTNDTRLPTELETTIDGAQPNPFCDATTISFALPAPRNVRVTIYSLMGEPVRDLFDGELEAGTQTVRWNGCDNEGRAVPSGLYLYSIDDGRSIQSDPVVFVRR